MITILLIVLLAVMIVQLIKPLPAPAGTVVQIAVIAFLLCWILGLIPPYPRSLLH